MYVQRSFHAAAPSYNYASGGGPIFRHSMRLSGPSGYQARCKEYFVRHSRFSFLFNYNNKKLGFELLLTVSRLLPIIIFLQLKLNKFQTTYIIFHHA